MKRIFTKHNLALFVAGALATLALAPFFVWPLWFVCVSYLYIKLKSAESPKRAFWDGWWWTLGYFTAGFYWIINSLLVDAAQFAWMIPFSLFGLPAVLAVYIGLACMLVRRVNLPGLAGTAFFAAAVTAAEWLRGHLFSGFPWNMPAYVLNASDETLQLAYLLGAYGCTFAVMFIAAMPGLAVVEKRKYPAFIAIIATSAVFLWGSWRLEHNPTSYVDGAKIRLVQGNIEQKLKWQKGEREKSIWQHIGLSLRDDNKDIKAVIWSESAVPFLLTPDSELTQVLAEAVPPNGVLITGADREEDGGWYNSMFVIGQGGKLLEHYDKHHLVPFGEYVPLRKYLPLISMVYGGGDFKSGAAAMVLKIPGLPEAKPLICYEAIFPEEAADGSKGAAWLLNITNDAWFGDSTGPRQHLEMARMRAVETGLPLVRVANTGISAVIDPLGRVLQKTELNKEVVVDFYLPQKLFPQP